jgi:hypothetical protein
MREGRWDPLNDPVPSDIIAMSAYAATKGIKFLAYVYPCLHFEALKEYFLGGGINALDLGQPAVQDWFIARMLAFMAKAGSGGWAWDHDIFTDGASPAQHYAQWRGWMRILAALRSEYPDMVMDHRQTAHIWGPWCVRKHHHAHSLCQRTPLSSLCSLNSLHSTLFVFFYSLPSPSISHFSLIASQVPTRGVLSLHSLHFALSLSSLAIFTLFTPFGLLTISLASHSSHSSLSSPSLSSLAIFTRCNLFTLFTHSLSSFFSLHVLIARHAQVPARGVLPRADRRG